MPNRSERVVTYLTEDEKADLAQMADEVGKSHSDLMRDAITEYLDRDRGDRIEEKVDEILAIVGEGETPTQPAATHTRKQTAGGSETVEKARLIAERIYENHDDVVQEVDVKRAIEDIAGGDERTISKYKQMLKERELMFQHPSSDATLWTSESETWVEWAESYIDSMPETEIYDVVDEYAMKTDDFIELAEGIHE